METNDACFKSWAAGGIGLRFSLRAGICHLLEALTPPKQTLFYALERSWLIKIRDCALRTAYLHILLRRIPLVVALREPLAVAASLHARNGFSLNHGLVLWWIYNHHIASQLCSDDLLLFYDDLLAIDDKLAAAARSIPRAPQAFQAIGRPNSSLIANLIKTELNRFRLRLMTNPFSRTSPTLRFELLTPKSLHLATN